MPDVLRFGPAKDDEQVYSDGTRVPHRLSPLERLRPDGAWETVGYVECHAHRVLVDAADVEDVSIGVTVRINPKTRPHMVARSTP